MAVSKNNCCYYLAPSWFLNRKEDHVEATDLVTGTELRIEGVLQDELAESGQGATARLRSLSRFDASLVPLVDSLEQQRPVPLTRASLLKGPGYGILFVELTGKCNEACLHCYADAGPARKEALTKDAIRSIVEDAAALDFHTIQFTGGDPLLSPYLTDGVAYARELGIKRIEVFTNGLALTGKLYEELEKQQVAFAFSFYSHDPAIHDKVTQTPGSQKRTAEAISRVARDGLEFRVGVIGMESNTAGIEKTIRFLQDLGVSGERIGVTYERSVGRGEMVEEPPIEHWPHAEGASHAPHVPIPLMGKAAVSYDGNVYPCIFGRDIILGNIYRERLASILNAPLPLTGPGFPDAPGIASWGEKLSCWECRVRAAFLAGPGTGMKDCSSNGGGCG